MPTNPALTKTNRQETDVLRLRTMGAVTAAAIALTACIEVPDFSGGGVTYNRNVAITNETGRTIWRLYGARVSGGFGSSNMLGAEELPNGATTTVNFEDGSGYCRYDMMAEFRSGETRIMSNVDVCSVRRVTFR